MTGRRLAVATMTPSERDWLRVMNLIVTQTHRNSKEVNDPTQKVLLI